MGRAEKHGGVPSGHVVGAKPAKVAHTFWAAVPANVRAGLVQQRHGVLGHGRQIGFAGRGRRKDERGQPAAAVEEGMASTEQCKLPQPMRNLAAAADVQRRAAEGPGQKLALQTASPG